MPQVKNKKIFFLILIGAVAGLGGFLFGFDSSIIAVGKDQIAAQFGLSDLQWSLIVSVSLLGCMVGIPISGLIADRISRKSMLLFVAVGFIAGAILCAEAHTLTMLIFGRFLVGVCIGIASYISPLFIAEMAPPNIRGGMILMNGLAITFGQAFSFLLGYFIHDVSESSWRILLWMGTIPASCLLIGLIFIPHSPRWAMAKYGRERAREILSTIRINETLINTELKEIQDNLTESRVHWSALFKKPLLSVLIMGLALGFFQQFSGINGIMYYGPVIFESAGYYPIKNAILATFWMGLINFIFTIVTLLLVDRLGRRFLLLRGTLIAAISMLIVSMYYQFKLFDQQWIMFVGMASFIIGYCISLGSLFWVIISEIYPLKVRGLAMSLATVMLWGSNFLVSVSFLQVFHDLGEFKTFGLLGFMCFLAYIFIYHFIPETTNVSLEKIEKNLEQGKKLRELGAVI